MISCSLKHVPNFRVTTDLLGLKIWVFILYSLTLTNRTLVLRIPCKPHTIARERIFSLKICLIYPDIRVPDPDVHLGNGSRKLFVNPDFYLKYFSTKSQWRSLWDPSYGWLSPLFCVSWNFQQVGLNPSPSHASGHIHCPLYEMRRLWTKNDQLQLSTPFRN